MLRLACSLLFLGACTSRPFDDGPDDAETGEPTTNGEASTDSSVSVGSLDDPSGPNTTIATTVGTVTVTSGDPVPSFDVDIQPIIDEHCVVWCHEPDGEWGFLLDMSGNGYDAIVDVPSPQFPSMSIIEPGDPGSSYLWHKINGSQASVGGSGLTMPKARAGMQATVLTAEQVAAIEQWILAGAPP